MRTGVKILIAATAVGAVTLTGCSSSKKTAATSAAGTTAAATTTSAAAHDHELGTGRRRQVRRQGREGRHHPAGHHVFAPLDHC